LNRYSLIRLLFLHHIICFLEARYRTEEWQVKLHGTGWYGVFLHAFLLVYYDAELYWENSRGLLQRAAIFFEERECKVTQIKLHHIFYLLNMIINGLSCLKIAVMSETGP
jgi:hypothetical protein